MNLAYTTRLVCLSLACFFAAHSVAALVVAALAPAAIGVGGRLRAAAAARWMLGLRMAPLAAGLMVVAGLCVPSYLWLETQSGGEQVGWACLGAAVLGGVLLTMAAARGARAAVVSWRHTGEWVARGRRVRLGDGAAEARVLGDTERPVIALCGLVRPRLAISRRVLEELSAEELEAVLRHERAHARGQDNWKRLLILLAPDALPRWRPLAALERQWARWAEWAADDVASAGDDRQALALASALVRMARLGAVTQPAPLETSLVGRPDELAGRVARLVGGAAPASQSAPGRPGPGVVAAGAMLLAAGVLLAAMAQPATLERMHRLLESWIH